VSEGIDRHYCVHRTTNQVVGLLIMAAGIALLVLVFLWAYQLYQSINGATFGVQPMVTPAHVAGTPPLPAPAGALTAKPSAGMAPTTAALVLFARLFALLVMGWVAGLLASKGVALATGTPHKPH